MLSITRRYSLFLFSFFLAFGNFDPVFGVGASVGFKEISCVVFLTLIIVGKDSRKYLYISFETLMLIGCLVTLTFAAARYGATFYGDNYLNIKFTFAIVFFHIFSKFLRIDSLSTEHLLFAFILGAVSYGFFVIYLNVSAIEIINGRLLIFGENPNSTSFRFALGFSFAFYFLISDNSFLGKYKYALVLVLPFFLSLVVQSGSRGSLLLTVISTFVTVYFSNIAFKKKILSTIILILLAPFLMAELIQNETMYNRVMQSIESGNTAGRDTIWNDAFEIFLRYPLLGAGESGYFDNILNYQGRYIDTHNLFLYLLVASGMTGFTFFTLFFTSLAKKTWDSFRSGYVVPVLIFINIFVLIMKTGGVLTYLLLWFFAGIISAQRSSNE